MNPWAEVAKISLVNPNSPVAETFHAIQTFEKERKESNFSSFRRNEAFWMELKKIHSESLSDLTDFIDYLNNKKESCKKQALALAPITKPDSNGKSVSKSVPTCTSSGNKGGDDLPKSPMTLGAGMQTRKALEEFDASMSSKFAEEADFLEKDLIKNFVGQVDSMEVELKSLWSRGDRLLFAVKLSDLRAKKNFDIFSNLLASQNKHEAEFPHLVDADTDGNSLDLWLSEVCYSVAAARSYEIKDECNKQLKFLFARAKEFENRRRSLLAKAGEMVLTRQYEMWRNLPLQATIMGERVARIQTDPSDPLCNMGRTLASRVETSHDAVAIAMMAHQDRTKERERGQGQGEAGATTGPPLSGIEALPQLPFPLRSPSLLESSIFYRLSSSSLLSKTWTPVLLCLSAAGYLHVFDIDPQGEMSTDTSAFSNIAQQSKRGIELDIFTSMENKSQKSSTIETPTIINAESLNFILKTESFMVPVLSLYVRRCTVQFTPTAKDTVFEVIESTPNTGVGSLFRSINERRIILRGNSQAEMINWILKIEGSSPKPK